MNIRFIRPLAALGLAAVIAVVGIGGAVTPNLQQGGAPADTALQFNGAPTNPDLQFALQFNGAPTNPDLQSADFLDIAPVNPTVQFS